MEKTVIAALGAASPDSVRGFRLLKSLSSWFEVDWTLDDTVSCDSPSDATSMFRTPRSARRWTTPTPVTWISRGTILREVEDSRKERIWSKLFDLSFL